MRGEKTLNRQSAILGKKKSNLYPNRFQLSWTRGWFALKLINSILLVKIFVSFLQPQEDLLCALQGGSSSDFLLHALEQLPEHRLQHHFILAGEMGHAVPQSNLCNHHGVATNIAHCARATRPTRCRRTASFPRKPQLTPGGGAAVEWRCAGRPGSGFGV